MPISLSPRAKIDFNFFSDFRKKKSPTFFSIFENSKKSRASDLRTISPLNWCNRWNYFTGDVLCVKNPPITFKQFYLRFCEIIANARSGFRTGHFHNWSRFTCISRDVLTDGVFIEIRLYPRIALNAQCNDFVCLSHHYPNVLCVSHLVLHIIGEYSLSRHRRVFPLGRHRPIESPDSCENVGALSTVGRPLAQIRRVSTVAPAVRMLFLAVGAEINGKDSNRLCLVDWYNHHWIHSLYREPRNIPIWAKRFARVRAVYLSSFVINQ